MSKLAKTPKPPFYAVIFPNQRTADDDEGYQKMAARMVELAELQPGCIGYESVRGEDGFGITVSYWRDEASIRAWKRDAEHQEARSDGKEKWYENFAVRVAKVERDYGFEK